MQITPALTRQIRWQNLMHKTSEPITDNALSAVCIGAANLDICCAFDLSSVDGTSNVANISQSVGGAALNTARILASNYIDTTFVGLAGNDEGGEMIASALSQANVNNRIIRQSDAATGRYISLLEPDGSLKIACNDMKIHEEFTAQMLETQLIKGVLAKIDALFCDANIPADIIGRAFDLAPHSLKCATTVSPAKAHRLIDSLENIDVLFTNVAEAHALLKTSINTPIQELANLMVASPVKSGVISNGINPVYFWQDGEVGTRPIPHTERIVDVIGAGDALAAGTIAKMLTGENLAEALTHGIKTAQKVLRVKGAYSPRFA